MEQLRFGTLNAHGLEKLEHNDRSLSVNLFNVMCDISKNKLDAIAVQESWFGKAEYSQKEKGFDCFFVNDEGDPWHGTGIIIRSDFNPSFRRISGRVCTASFKIDNDKHFLFISAYAPHETISNSKPAIRDQFYEDLNSALKQRHAKTIVILALDANARTSYNVDLPHVLGHFTKGDVTNSNGHRLIQFAEEHGLFLTNTKFQHKPSQRSTWRNSYRPTTTKNGEIRKNPVRNQIDYILIDKRHLRFVTEARSVNNIQCDSDHNLVVMHMTIQLSRINAPKKALNPEINCENFKLPEYTNNYQQKVTELHNTQTTQVSASADERWTTVVNRCNVAGKEVLGLKEKSKPMQVDKEISALKEQRHTLKNNLNGCNNNDTRIKFENERKRIKKQIKSKLKENDEKALDDKMSHLENMKDDTTKYFYVMRDIQKMNRNTKSTIIVKDKDGNIPGSNTDKIKIIEGYFKSTLAPEDKKDNFLEVPPQEMRHKFTAKEIKDISKRLNTGKASGPDKLKAELIKNAPDETFQEIAEILNHTAATGDAPSALQHGLLHPVPKPGKKQGPPENFRPIILLSILRKILTIALLNRIWDRLAIEIPKTQGAYQKGRSTTEQVLALKILIDKALNSQDYDLHILLLDMSKAFDTVNRHTLMTDLQKTLEADELHLLAILTNRPRLSVTLDGDTGDEFPTYVGICQGDCLSAVLFIYYLACALKVNPEEQVQRDLKAFLDVFYADDLTYATTSKDHKEEIKQEEPKKLKKYDLLVNDTKTEEGEAPDRRPPPPPPPPPLKDPGDKLLWSELDWLKPPKMPVPVPTYKNLKLLGTKLDTQCDIDARKAMVWNPVRKCSVFFRSKRLSASHKIRVFKTYVEPVLLYNSETWIMNKNQEELIDGFHRRLLRLSLNIRYPKTISTKKLYTLTQEIPLSDRIRKRRLVLLGHILRLHQETPAQRALQYFMTPHKRRVGRPNTTWIDVITKDLEKTLKFHRIKTPLNLASLQRLKILAEDRALWREEVARSKGRNS